MKKEIFSSVEFEATHYWENCDIPEVMYLRNEHRHVFHIKAYKIVDHNDRDTEFIWLKHKIEAYLGEQYPERQLGGQSCEMLAEELIGAFVLSKCEVSEDGENGVVLDTLRVS